MKNHIFFFLVSCLVAPCIYSQVTNKIQADSVKIYQVSGLPAELIIENSTKSKQGSFLHNRHNGRTEFAYALDSVWLDNNFQKFRLGEKTLTFNLAGFGSNDSAFRRNDTIYYVKNGTEISLGTYLTKNTADLLYKAIGYVPSWSEITGKPSEFTPVAGNSNYIQNQSGLPQPGNFWIDHYGRIGLQGGDATLSVNDNGYTASNMPALLVRARSSHLTNSQIAIIKSVAGAEVWTISSDGLVKLTGANAKQTITSTTGGAELRLSHTGTNGKEWVIGSSSLTYAAGSGAYVIFDQTSAVYRYCIKPTGEHIINHYNTLASGYTFQVNGSLYAKGIKTDSTLFLANMAVAPPGTNGGTYYGTTLNQFQGYRNGAWKNFTMEGDAVANQNDASQNANAWISGNFRSDGNINLFGTTPRINFYEPDSRYSIYRNGTAMTLSSGSAVEIISGIGGAIKLKQNTTDKIGVEADGSVRFYASVGLLAQAVAPTSPAPLNGYMYYNNLVGFQGYRNGAWKNFTMEGDAVASTNGTHSGLLTLTNTPIIRATNTTLLIDGNSSAGNVVISGSMTGPGVTIKKPGGEGQMLRLYDEVAEPTGKNTIAFGYKRTANYAGDIFAGFTGYFSSVNMIQIPLSNFGGGTGADNTKGWWVDFSPLGKDGITPTIWRKVNGTTVWKEYGTKTELYPDGDAGTNFTIGAQAVNINTLKTTGTAPATTGTTKPVVADANGQLSFSDWQGGGGAIVDSSIYATRYWANSQFKSISYTPTWSEITGKPTLASVATSGSYNDLSSKPAIPAQVNLTSGTNISITGTYPNLTINSSSSLEIINDEDYTVAAGVTNVIVDMLTANRTVTLPDAATNENRKIGIRMGEQVNGTRLLYISPAPKSSAIGTSLAIGSMGWVEVIAKNGNWWVVSEK